MDYPKSQLQILAEQGELPSVVEEDFCYGMAMSDGPTCGHCGAASASDCKVGPLVLEDEPDEFDTPDQIHAMVQATGHTERDAIAILTALNAAGWTLVEKGV